MKKKYVPIISLLIICSAAITYITSSRNTVQDPQHLHAFINTADLQAITLARGTLSLELAPRGSEWYMHIGDTLIKVEADSIIKLLDFVNTATIVRRITKKTDAYPRFNLTDETALIITLQTNSERSTLYVGNDKDRTYQFVRLPENPAVYLASKTLDTGPEPWRWYYRRILQYPLEMLDYILYDCGEKNLHLQRDAANGKLAVRNAPEGQISADLGQLAAYFSDLGIADYVPRSGAPEAEELASHTLHFKDGSFATLRFLDREEEKDIPPFLDIVFGGKEPVDDNLRYAKDICSRYIFSLSWIDKSKYMKPCEDFFVDQLPLAADKNNNTAPSD